MFSFVLVYSRISTNVCIKSVQSLFEIGLYDAKYQTVNYIFAAAQKNIFGKVVTLLLLLHTMSILAFDRQDFYIQTVLFI